MARYRILKFFVVFLFTLMRGTVLAIDVEPTYYFDGKNGYVETEGILNASSAEVWSVLVDYDHQKKYMPRTPESLFISEEGVKAIQKAGTKNANRLISVARRYQKDQSKRKGLAWQVTGFGVADLPFPAENRWTVFKMVQDETKSHENVFSQCWEALFGNVNLDKGCWTIRSLENSVQSHVHYWRRLDMGGNVPHWVAKIGMYYSVKEMFRNLEKEVQH